MFENFECLLLQGALPLDPTGGFTSGSYVWLVGSSYALAKVLPLPPNPNDSSELAEDNSQSNRTLFITLTALLTLLYCILQQAN
jgi:hypothetical protein